MPGPTPGVWRRGKSGWWYTTLGGRQRKLCKGTKTQAQDELRKLLGKPLATQKTHGAVGDILDAYCEWMESPGAATTPGRLNSVKLACKSFYDYAGAFRVADLTPAHAKEWLDLHPGWASSSRATMVGIVRACFNWAMLDEVGLVDRQPLGKFRGGTYTRKSFLATPEDIDKLQAYHNPAYRDLVVALVNTGCRPSEVSRVEACDVDIERRCWTMTRHKNARKKPAPRIVWLNSEMVKLTRRLMKANPQGPLFRNSLGTPWNATTVKQAFAQMRRTLGLDPRLGAYSLRHEFITRSLASGNDALTVATTCGTSVQMLSKHYSHLMQVPSHMLAAMERATRKAPAARPARTPAETRAGTKERPAHEKMPPAP